MTPFAATVRSILPECLLIATACAQFLVGPFLVQEGKPAGQPAPAARPVSSLVSHGWSVVSLAALLGAAWLCFAQTAHQSYAAVLPMVESGSFAWFIRVVAILAGVVLVLINWDEVADEYAAEFNGLLLLIVAGVSLTAAANDLVVLFLGLELVSIPTYVFLYLPRRQPRIPEATIKYFLLSIFSSAIALYGFSFLYGVVGTTQLGAIHTALARDIVPMGDAPAVLWISAACIVAGLSFRITAVPFHFYAPDVFQGSHAGAAALLAFLPKLVGFAALLRIIGLDAGSHPHASLAEGFRQSCASVFWLMAVASMFVGNVLALLQRDLKRLLAYSSVAHAGYMLVGLAVGNRSTAVEGVPALLFYLVSYGATIAGVFGLLIYLRRGNRPLETVDELAGLSQSHPAAAAALAILLFSLTGLPPTAGFLGKLNLLLAAWSQGTWEGWSLAMALVVNAAIGATYYLRIVGVMYLRPQAAAVHTTARLPALIGIAICVLVSVGLFFFPGILWSFVDEFAA